MEAVGTFALANLFYFVAEKVEQFLHIFSYFDLDTCYTTSQLAVKPREASL